ncbi:hypothetical protein ADN00_07530 [Ornatilinea apprima]|uniref:DUF4914 domain-containing protein n=1 Tax=Ornatilinea apprima TaxID=1134406 RepID=A0A0P6XT79_9CHLR|nr:DUF4914 family protein [Ornatilinea apprima]KPL78300.1 hypothetical protein ADN00_07530 [Ornatilinea apprima]
MWQKLNPPEEIAEIFRSAPKVVVASTLDELFALSTGTPDNSFYEVAYDVPGKGQTVEATVARVRNGIAVNYVEPYMRRRDPDSLVVGDEDATDKLTYKQIYGEEFEPVRASALEWLKGQELAVFAFTAGQPGMGVDALAIAPLNAGFFALGLAMLQGITPVEELDADFQPKAVLFVAPPFRHTHFKGKQIVVHNRRPDLYEIFSFNLYPGPSAKKGVYGIVIDIGAREGWVAPHCSTVVVVTPYDNAIVIMHEGASGGGKSEMLEQAHRESDGRLLLGENVITGEKRYVTIPRTCDLKPVTDDMAICHPSLQRYHGRMRVTDAEDAWFVRVNHIDSYGVDPSLERITAQPSQPLLFLNIDAAPNSRALIWEHIQDAPGKPCPNPRVIVPRNLVPNVIKEPVTVDVRSFGVRTPPCTKENPTYGIIGLFHILPPALAWLWRLVSPRGYDNPSIVSEEGMSSEGVGSYWPFAAGKMVRQANLLLEQFDQFRQMRYILTPNQYIGAWRVGFMPQWLAREYLARRGNAKFRPEHIRAARSPLLGYALHNVHVEGYQIPRWFLQVDTQPEVGVEAYDQGASMLRDFFLRCLKDFNQPDLTPLGRQIIECCLDGGIVSDYEALIKAE